MKSKKPRVTAEEFVRLWQTTQTLTEVCAWLETTPGAAGVRASSLRKRGVQLKKFVGGATSLDIPKLVELAKSLNGEVTS